MGPPQNDSTTSRSAPQEAGSPTLEAHSIDLAGGRRAIAVLASADVSGHEAVAALALPTPRGVIVLNGGTIEVPPDLSSALRRSVGDGIARVAVEETLTVVTGGTDAGIFSLFGQALGEERTAPCIGVVPAGRVTWPGRAVPAERGPADEELVQLEAHHSHFLLVAGEEWGVETEAMLALIEALSASCASLAVLAGGGTGARREVLGHVRAGREVIVLRGTGRFADELVGVIAGSPTADHETAEIAATRLVTVVDGAADKPFGLTEIVRARLGIGENRERP